MGFRFLAPRGGIEIRFMNIWSAVKKIWPIKRVQELVDAIFEHLMGIRVEQGRLEAMVHQCSLQLDQYSQRLDQYSQRLDQYSQRLDQYSRDLERSDLSEGLRRLHQSIR